MKKINISAVVIARNEEKRIAGCLNSIRWADEILFFDDHSEDNTAGIVKNSGVKVLKIPEGLDKDFSERKNFAFGKAKSSWILSIDADERITPQLKKEILNSIKSSQYSAYAFPRKNIILGKELKHGWYPDYVIRLFLKRDFLVMEGSLHEQPRFKGNLGYLKNNLLHLKHDNLSDMVEKTNSWSGQEALLMFNSKHPQMNIARFISAGFREFWLRVIRQKSYLDGAEGVIYAFYQVFSRLMSYSKLWERQLKNSEREADDLLRNPKS